MEIPNGGSVWEADWADDVDAPKRRTKKFLGYEYYEDEDSFISKEGISGEAANKIVDFEESRMLFGNKTKRLTEMAENESLGKAA